jgi:hypothetical protein
MKLRIFAQTLTRNIMIISQESTVLHPNPIKPNNHAQPSTDDSKLKELFIDVLKDKDEYDETAVNWRDEETVEVNNISNMSLHSFLLKAEQMGKDITYTKKTIIKIS